MSLTQNQSNFMDMSSTQRHSLDGDESVRSKTKIMKDLVKLKLD